MLMTFPMLPIELTIFAWAIKSSKSNVASVILRIIFSASSSLTYGWVG